MLALHPKLLDLPTFLTLDAKEAQTRSYLVFMAKVPTDFTGVSTVRCEANSLVLTERGSGRVVTVPIGELRL